jgi:glyoxylase-like metal-dependent hydrolase (beta-lactamase superfamily II)
VANEPSIQAVVIPVTPFQQNCSLIWCSETRRGAFVDPGGEVDRLIKVAATRQVVIEKILVTHGHVDHAGGVADLAEQLKIPIEGPQQEDRFWIDGIAAAGAGFGMTHCRPFTPNRWLEDGDIVTVGQQSFEVRHCPGHTPGHVVFFHAGEQLAFVGDVLFQGSIGRTDFPRGDYATLIRSITTRLWPLGDDVTFIPGHGPVSTFGDERATNPFVGDKVLRATE